MSHRRTHHLTRHRARRSAFKRYVVDTGTDVARWSRAHCGVAVSGSRGAWGAGVSTSGGT
ncbi:hypothetical protein V6Z11_A01G222800 [Gossypium hirsutum]